NDVVVRRRDRDRADGRNGFLVEERRPIRSTIRRFPNAARDGAEIVCVRSARNPFNGQRTTAAEWTDLAPLHSAEKFFIDRPRRDWRGRRRRICGPRGERGEEKEKKAEERKAKRHSVDWARRSLRSIGMFSGNWPGLLDDANRFRNVQFQSGRRLLVGDTALFLDVVQFPAQLALVRARNQGRFFSDDP